MPTRSDPYNPNPQVYPACSKCKAPYVLRRGLRIMVGEWQWAWFRDCKCRNADPEMVDNRKKKPAKKKLVVEPVTGGARSKKR